MAKRIRETGLYNMRPQPPKPPKHGEPQQRIPGEMKEMMPLTEMPMKKKKRKMMP